MTSEDILVKIIQNEDPVIVDVIRQYVTRNILEELYSELIYCYLAKESFSFQEFEKIEKKYITRGWYQRQ